MPDPDTSLPTAGPPPRPRRTSRSLVAAAALLGAGLVGAGGTALVMNRPQATLVALTPAPIASLQPWTAVAVKGQVAELYGNKFILQDDSGRALVDTGPGGEDSPPVAKAEAVTVQGRFDRGEVHALAISHADGRTDILGPAGPPGPRRGPLAWLDRHWFGHWRHADLTNVKPS